MQDAAIHLHGQNDSSSILDGTSFTSDTQPAVLFVSFIFFNAVSVHIRYLSRFW